MLGVTSLIDALEPRRLLAIAIDPSFGDAGTGLVPVTTSGNSVVLVSEVANSRILVVGASASQSGTQRVVIGRLNADGSPDTSFGSGGAVEQLNVDFVSGAAIDSDGKIVVVGALDADQAFVARFTAAGAPDTTFSSDGIAQIALVGQTEQLVVHNVAIAPDEKIVLAAHVRENDDSSQFILARLTSNGDLDSTFSGDGIVRSQRNFVDSALLAVQNDNAVVVTGRDNDDAFVARYTPSGVPDSSFGTAGFFVFPRSRPGGDLPGAIAVQSDAKIVISTDSFVGRLNTDGTPDNTFDGDGVSQLIPSSDLTAGMVIDDSTGAITVLAGQFLRQVDSSGAVNPNFGSEDIFGDRGVLVGFGNGLALTSDGDFLVGVAAGAQGIGARRAGERPDVALGPGGTLVVTGTTGDDTIVVDVSGSNARVSRNGTITNFPLADVTSTDISLLDGNDSLSVSVNVPCTILGDAGNKTVSTGAANDTITTSDGNDVISSGSGDDSVLAGDGNNSVNSGAGNDAVFTRDGDDTINAGAGDDNVQSEFSSQGEDGGDDQITGGDGNDTILAAGGDNSISGGDGDDFVQSTDGDDTISGDGGNDAIRGGDGSNQIHGGDGNDTLVTGEGRDSLYGEGGKDELRAGFGSDLLSGGGGKDKLFGQQGKDRIYGGINDDQIDGGPNDDRLFGGDGNDKLFGGPGDDLLTGGDDSDFLYAAKGNDTLFAKDSTADTVNGGGGQDQGQVDDPLDSLRSVESLISASS